MILIKEIAEIFNKSINDYHIYDNIETQIKNPFEESHINNIFYKKNWIDTVQWHFEDIIREPNIESDKAVKLKRLIDKYNQIRTDMVEQIDDYFYEKYKNIKLNSNFRLNTETLGWAIDRLSILCLKIYHMKIEADRKDANNEHLEKCKLKLNILLQQQQDLFLSISQLEDAIKNGEVKILIYRQMKMYNDPNTNPVLYNKKK